MQGHLAATDCAELTALICPEPLLEWIVNDSLCPKLVNWSSSARIAFLRQTRLRTETGCPDPAPAHAPASVPAPATVKKYKR